MLNVQRDPSRAGGACRSPCHAAKDPKACCKAKAGVCRDADCGAAGYTGRLATAAAAKPVFSKPAPQPAPTQCSRWTTSCSAFSNPEDCCAAKPAVCYDAGCIGGRYLTVPVFYGSTFAQANASPTVGATCTSWPCTSNAAVSAPALLQSVDSFADYAPAV